MRIERGVWQLGNLVESGQISGELSTIGAVGLPVDVAVFVGGAVGVLGVLALPPPLCEQAASNKQTAIKGIMRRIMCIRVSHPSLGERHPRAQR